jgi:hypothetical protein
MVDPSSLGNAGNTPVNPASAIAPGKSQQQEQAQGTGGPAFRALLDNLQEQSKSLSVDSQKLEKPEDLPDAVSRARSTLTDALSLSDQLLEAYRQASQDKDPNAAGEEGK